MASTLSSIIVKTNVSQIENGIGIFSLSTNLSIVPGERYSCLNSNYVSEISKETPKIVRLIC